MPGVMLLLLNEMNKSIGRSLPLLALIALIGSHAHALAQRRLWREASAKPSVKFDWNCASPSQYPDARLSRVVRVALSRNYPGVETWGDRAFAFDLNGDRKPEYFVPLVCQWAGNCTWGVFALNPAGLLGVVNGEYIYVHQRKGSWPTIITYGHLSVVEGSIHTYRFRKGRYTASGAAYPINRRYGTYDLDIQGGPGHKLPGFLERARAGCGEIGG
jgi:hypothetical protein